MGAKLNLMRRPPPPTERSSRPSRLGAFWRPAISLVNPLTLGKGKHTPPFTSEDLKEWGPQRKISAVDMAFLVFKRGICIYHRPGKFSLRPEKVSKRFSFGGGSVRFFLLCLQLLPLQKAHSAGLQKQFQSAQVLSETRRMRFRRVRFHKLSSVSFFALESSVSFFALESSVSSSQPILEGKELGP